MKIFRSFLVLFVLLITSGCSRVPLSFIKTYEPSWSTIEFREGVSYDEAWKTTMDILIRNFDIEVSQKENGYLRTGYIYTWTGQYTDYYRVRVTVKFNQEKKNMEIKSEAYYKDYIGYDTRLVETLKTDLMGTIGRITR